MASLPVFGQLRKGVAEQTTDTVESLTGSRPRSFAQFARGAQRPRDRARCSERDKGSEWEGRGGRGLGAAPSTVPDDDRRAVLRKARRRHLGIGDGPFELTARAWAVARIVP